MAQYVMRNIDELINKKQPRKKMTAEELNHAAYLAEIAQQRDFTSDVEKRRWPEPIGPLWRN